MRTKLFITLAIAAGTFAFSGCQKEGCTDSSALNYDADAKKDDGSCLYDESDTTSMVMLHVHPKLGTADFAFDTEVTNWEGRKMKFEKAQMYVSNFAFHKDGGGMQMVDDSYFLFQPGTMMYELGEIPNGHYHGLEFMVGVDSVANRLTDPASWPSDHALSSNNPDHAFWSWNSGYIFIQIEGEMDSTAAMNGAVNAPFAYHVGLDANAREVMKMMHQDVDADVTLDLAIDYLKLFDGIDLRANPVTHSMGGGAAPASAMADNVASAITVE